MAVEACSCLQSVEFVPADKSVKIQGYTAERLIEELGLLPIRAYKTLADLCDDSFGTSELIKKEITKKLRRLTASSGDTQGNFHLKTLRTLICFPLLLPDM